MAGCVVGWTLVGDGEGRVLEVTSGNGCPSPSEVCPTTDAAPFADTAPPYTPGAAPTAATATPTATPTPSREETATPTPRATTRRPSPSPSPTRRTAASRPAPARTTSSLPTVEYAFRSQWDTGYVVMVRLTNTSQTTWNGWTLSFRLGDGSTITSSWDTRLSGRSGYLRARDDGWNAVVAPGEDADFGMEGTGSFRATGCVLNGQPCRFSYGGTVKGGRGHAPW